MALSTVATTLDHRAAAWPGAAVISSLPAHALLRFVHLDTDVELLVGFRHPCASGTRAAGPADCHRCRTVAGRDSASGAPGFESLNSPSPRLEQGLDLDLGPLLLARRGSVSAEVGASFAHAPAPLWECWREFPGWRGYRWHRPRPGLAERPQGASRRCLLGPGCVPRTFGVRHDQPRRRSALASGAGTASIGNQSQPRASAAACSRPSGFTSGSV